MRDKDGRALTTAHVLGFLRRISKLLFYGIRPVFVFDSGAPAVKRSTLNERREKKPGAAVSHAKLAEKLLPAQPATLIFSAHPSNLSIPASLPHHCLKRQTKMPPPPTGGAGVNGRDPLQDISPPPSPPLLSNRNDDEDPNPRRRRVPSTSSTLLPSVSRSQLSSTSLYFSNTSTAGPPNTSLTSSMALSPTLHQTAPTRNESPPMSEMDVDWAIFDEMERAASNMNNNSSNNKGKKKATTATTSTKASALSDLTLLGELQQPTAFPRIFAAPPSLNSKLQLAPGFNAQNIVNPNASGNNRRTVIGTSTATNPRPPTDDEEDMFDGMMYDDIVLGSDDLRMLENAEQEVMAATTSATTSKFLDLSTSSENDGTTKTDTKAIPPHSANQGG